MINLKICWITLKEKWMILYKKLKMIEISWLWLPLIITVILILLASILEENQDYGLFSILSVLSTVISIIIYVCFVIHFIYTHVKII